MNYADQQFKFEFGLKSKADDWHFLDKYLPNKMGYEMTIRVEGYKKLCKWSKCFLCIR